MEPVIMIRTLRVCQHFCCKLFNRSHNYSCTLKEKSAVL